MCVSFVQQSFNISIASCLYFVFKIFSNHLLPLRVTHIFFYYFVWTSHLDEPTHPYLMQNITQAMYNWSEERLEMYLIIIQPFDVVESARWETIMMLDEVKVHEECRWSVEFLRFVYFTRLVKIMMKLFLILKFLCKVNLELCYKLALLLWQKI